MIKATFQGVLLVLLFILPFVGCNKPVEKSSTESQKEDPLTTEDKIALEEVHREKEDDLEDRQAIREATREFVKKNLPNWKIEGISTFANTGNFYFVAVDISSEKGREILNLYARLFFKENGESYWMTQIADPETESLISKFLIKDRSLKLHLQELRNLFSDEPKKN